VSGTFDLWGVTLNSTSVGGEYFDINIASYGDGTITSGAIIGDDINIIAQDLLSISYTPITSYRPYYSRKERRTTMLSEDEIVDHPKYRFRNNKVEEGEGIPPII